MKSFLWWGGKALQVVALLQVGVALFLGVSTQDARLELQFLLLGAAVFILGVLLIKISKGSS